MDSRLALHDELLKFVPNAYYQPPSTIKMQYPCIVYGKTGKYRKFGNDTIYLSTQEYIVTVIETDPDSDVADTIEKYFPSCVISQYYTVDNLNHTTLNLYY